jgi:hypothetical protein
MNRDYFLQVWRSSEVDRELRKLPPPLRSIMRGYMNQGIRSLSQYRPEELLRLAGWRVELELDSVTLVLNSRSSAAGTSDVDRNLNATRWGPPADVDTTEATVTIEFELWALGAADPLAICTAERIRDGEWGARTLTVNAQTLRHLTLVLRLARCEDIDLAELGLDPEIVGRLLSVGAENVFDLSGKRDLRLDPEQLETLRGALEGIGCDLDACLAEDPDPDASPGDRGERF